MEVISGTRRYVQVRIAHAHCYSLEELLLKYANDNDCIAKVFEDNGDTVVRIYYEVNQLLVHSDIDLIVAKWMEANATVAIEATVLVSNVVMHDYWVRQTK